MTIEHLLPQLRGAAERERKLRDELRAVIEIQLSLARELKAAGCPSARIARALVLGLGEPGRTSRIKRMRTRLRKRLARRGRLSLVSVPAS